MDTSSALSQPGYKHLYEEDREAKLQGGDSLVSLSSSTSSSSSGLHKQKSFEFVDITTAGDSNFPAENATAVDPEGNITAYREVSSPLLQTQRSFIR